MQAMDPGLTEGHIEHGERIIMEEGKLKHKHGHQEGKRTLQELLAMEEGEDDKFEGYGENVDEALNKLLLQIVEVDRKTTNSASALGDLVARTTSVDDAEMNNIFNAAGAIFAPYAASDARLRVTSLVDNGGRAEVAWSDARGYRAYSPGTRITVPNGVLPSGGSVIMAEVQFQYESTLGYFFPTMRSLSDKFYLRPRRTTVIDRN